MIKRAFDLAIVVLVVSVLANTVFSGSTGYVVERIERLTQVMEG